MTDPHDVSTAAFWDAWSRVYDSVYAYDASDHCKETTKPCEPVSSSDQLVCTRLTCQLPYAIRKLVKSLVNRANAMHVWHGHIGEALSNPWSLDTPNVLALRLPYVKCSKRLIYDCASKSNRLNHHD